MSYGQNLFIYCILLTLKPYRLINLNYAEISLILQFFNSASIFDNQKKYYIMLMYFVYAYYRCHDNITIAILSYPNFINLRIIVLFQFRNIC
ncbi:MAG: hypothetical protein A2046_12465 [Bacteroidetes bacterium GWA2_30_7]|nr:MAG: hypothetical protein A2046_12465 [Bacteroidetes bacterium GWA2_30_7]